MKAEGGRKSRDLLANAVAAALAVLVSVAAIWALSQRSASYERDAANRSADYSRNAEREISRRCFHLPSADYAQCVNEGENAKRQYQREEENLAAQKFAAWWTAVTGAAAVAGVILSAFGVFLVYRTFRATREANEISRDTAKRELRAYLSLRPLIIGDMAPGLPFPVLTMPVDNSGATPANRVSSRGAWKVMDEEPTSELFDKLLNEYAANFEKYDIAHGPRMCKNMTYTVEISAEARVKVFAADTKHKFYFAGQIHYQDIFGDEHLTEFFYWYNPKLDGPHRLAQVGYRNKIG
jgi:hypothetical protein